MQPAIEQIGAVRQWLAAAHRVCVLTGAGVSAESGVPTFRGSQGMWKQFRPEDLATPEAFARDPQTVWEWYDWRRSLIAKVEPNPGHHALAALQRALEAAGRSFTLITQNVDRLHQRAGSRDVIEVHGSLWMLRCLACSHETEDLRVPLPQLPPRCPACSTGMLRPGVVWFGEGLHPATWDRAEHAARDSDLFLVAGTSSVVYPAASLAPLASAAGARIVEINPDATPLSNTAQAALRGPSGQILPLLVADW